MAAWAKIKGKQDASDVARVDVMPFECSLPSRPTVYDDLPMMLGDHNNNLSPTGKQLYHEERCVVKTIQSTNFIEFHNYY